MNKFYLEFFEISNNIKGNIDKENLTKKLIKLNNPTYHSKYAYKNPIERYGFSGKTINPIFVAINNMLKILKSDKKDADIMKMLQTEFSWAFHNFSNYKSIDL